MTRTPLRCRVFGHQNRHRSYLPKTPKPNAFKLGYMKDYSDDYDESRDYGKRFHWNAYFKEYRCFSVKLWHHASWGLDISLWYGKLEILLKNGWKK